MYAYKSKYESDMYILGEYACLHGDTGEFPCRFQYTCECACICPFISQYTSNMYI
jgi:hypothetical protein